MSKTTRRRLDAALKAKVALDDLSQHVQVIVLSHHRRLTDAARGLPQGIISVCDLAA